MLTLPDTTQSLVDSTLTLHYSTLLRLATTLTLFGTTLSVVDSVLSPLSSTPFLLDSALCPDKDLPELKYYLKYDPAGHHWQPASHLCYQWSGHKWRAYTSGNCLQEWSQMLRQVLSSRLPLFANNFYKL